MTGVVTGKEHSPRPHLPGIVIVKLNADIPFRSSHAYQHLTEQHAVLKVETMFEKMNRHSLVKKSLGGIYRLQLPDHADVMKVCGMLNGLSDVTYAEPDYLLPVEAVPNDPYFNIQYHLTQIRAAEAWDVVKGDSTVIIGIIDTGVDWDHPDLANAIWQNADEKLNGEDTDNNGYADDVRGWDFLESHAFDYPPAYGEDGIEADNDPMDFDGHGTHVAGIAAAVTDNAEGVASVSWNCSIMPLRAGYKATDGYGYIVMSAAAEAFVYAADNGAHVVNLSTSASNTIVDAARYAFDSGLVIVKSAGNDNRNTPDLLETQPYCLNVAAVDRFDQKTWYSDYGKWVSLSAPGERSYTTVIDKYGSVQGTSYCSPQAAGVAALIRTQHPDWSAADIIFQIMGTADNINQQNPNYSGLLGSGRINAIRAVTESVIPAPNIEMNAIVLIGGDDDGIAEAGERLSLVVEFVNRMGTAVNVMAELMIDHWAVSIDKGSASIGDIPGLRNLDENVKDNEADPFIITIDSLAIPQRVSGTVKVHDQNGYSQSFAIHFAISPSLLVVDDEELQNESYYYAALDSLGISYDCWNRDAQGSPFILGRYPSVVWFCGHWTIPSLDAGDRDVLKAYLDQGGSLFLSGQDIGWDLCDPNPPKDFANQRIISDGESKNFYEDYLRAIYLNDVAGYSQLSGVSGDPIGDGTSFQIYQPGRPVTEQYPSEIAPTDSAAPVFVYPDQGAAAVRHSGIYRSVYFAFGGWEAIVDEAQRFIVMDRTLEWMNGVSIVHTPLSNVGDTTQARTVNAQVISAMSPIARVDLFWDTDGEYPFKRKKMEKRDGNTYEGMIPAAGSNEVQYFILASTENGYTTPVKMHTYTSELDTVPPVISGVSSIPNSITRRSDHPVSAEVVDQYGVDTSSVKCEFRTSSNDSGSFHLTHQNGNLFSGILSGDFHYGDTVFYRIHAMDLSLEQNKTVSRKLHFIVGMEDFETGLAHWSGDWGLDSITVHSGRFALSDHSKSGIGYPDNSESIIRLNDALDFSDVTSASLQFWSNHELEDMQDFGYIELSGDDGATWTGIGECITGSSIDWKEYSYSLEDFIDSGVDVFQLRFRLSTDSSQAVPMRGWAIDDIRIVSETSTSAAGILTDAHVPDKYYLSQNYPNPFNPGTSIEYGLSAYSKVRINIYNLLGQRIMTLVNEFKSAGVHEVAWDGLDANGVRQPSGVYIYTMITNEYIQTNKMILLR
ncbi:MAG: S8 family peptidase [candidate division KSB1 bacterium]|nr:S8 family peptidase [candidate division KSB1 bacterium]